jgi:gliding motility-associated lipoprotein GldH
MTKGINSWSFVLILLAALLQPSCNSSVIYTNSQIFPNNTWALMNTPVFNIPVNDTINSNNFYFTIRTSTTYPFRNIFLFVTTTSPAGKSITDTLQYYLADEKGTWFGKGLGDIHELKLPYKSNVFFPLKGTYQVKIQHGMRIEDLKGIYDLGVKIEKISK